MLLILNQDNMKPLKTQNPRSNVSPPYINLPARPGVAFVAPVASRFAELQQRVCVLGLGLLLLF